MRRLLHQLGGVGVVLALSGVAMAAVPRPNVMPSPKELKNLKQTVDVSAGLNIVDFAPDDPRVRVGIEILRDHIVKLGGKTPAFHSKVLLGGSALTIVVGTAGLDPMLDELVRQFQLDMTAEKPGPQGYVIHFDLADGRKRILVIGSDAQGTLYACVTLSQMIRRDGWRVLVDAANIRDWPDFRRRKIGHPKAPSRKLRLAKSVDAVKDEYERYVRETKRYVDYCLEYKINLCSLRSGGTRNWSYIQSYGPALRAALREVTDYARDRGILFAAPAYSAIDVGQGGPAAALKDIVRTHGVGYCWSRDDMIRAQARHFGEFARDGGISFYYLHAPDRTGIDDPARFKERCSLCKIVWKDNERAKADAHVMNIMYEEIKRWSPDTDVCAVLVPYGATLNRLDPQVRDSIVRYWREAGSLLPEDMLICVRENRRANVAAFKNAFLRQPIYFYIESVYWRGWEPLFTTTPRMISTFDFNDPRDLYYLGNRADFAELTEIMAAHYAWNTHAPGAGLQRAYNHDPVHDGREPEVVVRGLVDAICSRMFGEVAGPLVGEAIRGDVSWSFTERPFEMTERAKDRLAGREGDIPGTAATLVDELNDVAGLMNRQYVGAERGCLALNAIVDKIDQGEVTLDAHQREQLNFLLSYFTSVRALAALRYPALMARRSLQDEGYGKAGIFTKLGLDYASSATRWIDEATTRVGGLANWYAPARSVRDQVQAQLDELDRLCTLSQGTVVDMGDSDDNLTTAVFLLRRGEVRLHSSGNGNLELTAHLARMPEHKALHYTRPDQAWSGCSVAFAPVDIRPYLKDDGYLRFYINSDGLYGYQRATFIPRIETASEGGEKPKSVGRWVYIHHPLQEERSRTGKPGFVEIDDLPQTWQLVSIPLRELVESDDAAFLSGWSLNFAAVPECGFIIADPYLVGNIEPVEFERDLEPEPRFF